MNTRKLPLTLVLLSTLFSASPLLASGEHPLSEGVVKKIVPATKKITIKHGPIDNLDMPPMSMVFGVSELSLLDGVAEGDNVKFLAVDKNGKLFIEEIVKQQ